MSQVFILVPSFSVLWQEWFIHGRSRHLRGCYGELVAVILLWISEKWRTGLNIQKRWELGGTAWKVLHPSNVFQLFSIAAFTGGNGAVDSVPHLLLGGADWTESEEDLRLVGEVLHQVVGLKCPDNTNQTIFLWTVGHPLCHMKMNFLISCSYSFHTQIFAYPESSAEREEILQGLQSRIEDIKSVSVRPKILCGF